MAVGYRFPILNSDGSPSDTIVDMDDMFVSADTFYEKGLYTWGLNSLALSRGSGQLGDGTVTHRSSPVQVGSLTNWKLVSAGYYHTTAVKIDGTLWTWGGNQFGTLGQNNLTHRSSPVQVGSLTNWKQVSGGGLHTAAIKTDGTLWAWGSNNIGQLGDGTIVDKSSPVQIGLLTNWKQVSSARFLTAAIKTDGTLWAWGRNVNGQLGDNTVIHRSSPVQIGSLTNWKQVSAASEYQTAAIKTDGTLWAWGRNNEGQLGDGTITPRSSPVQIGSLTNWKQVAVSNEHTAAIKTDGTLWAWGANNRGQLGDGTIVPKSSPVQVGSLTNWKQVAVGSLFADALNPSKFTVAIKTDGTLWAWGRGNLGQLGDNTITGKSSPIQIGSLTNWKQVAASEYHTAAISSSDY
jgi:alpha-tubulin suppressor-like RCC1 family protein